MGIFIDNDVEIDKMVDKVEELYGKILIENKKLSTK